ncbi:MAG: hypothetical protein Q9168_003602 [Polycauliona sp. 1 TL-2023]
MSEIKREDSASRQELVATYSQDAEIDHTEDHTLPDGAVVKAIRHEYLRTELLQKAEATYKWTHRQPHGEVPDDRTAPVDFPWDQKDWGWRNRRQYPPINFVLEKKQYKHPDYEVQLWYHEGRLVIDLLGKPVKKFKHLPDVCSSAMPGGHIEALMRLDDRMTYADIRARQPPKVIFTTTRGVWNVKPLRGVNALSASAKEFRETTGMLSWKSRAGVDAFNDYIRANLPADLKARNSTRDWRNITKAELATIREPGIGTRPGQARKRSSPDEARELREKHIKKRKASAKRDKATANHESEDDQTSTSSSDSEEGSIIIEASEADDSSDSDDWDITKKPDIRKQIPETPEENIALRDALEGTITQAESIIGKFQPIIHERQSYTWQMHNVQKQFAERYEVLFPGQGEAPRLSHLIPWRGSIHNWRSGLYFDGEWDYLIGEDGKIGSRVGSPEPATIGAFEEDTSGDRLAGEDDTWG